MTMYRQNAADGLVVPEPPKRRVRPLFIAVGSIALHAAIFGAAFASRAPERPAPTSITVPVLSGWVDPWTGDFYAKGVRMARVRN